MGASVFTVKAVPKTIKLKISLLSISYRANTGKCLARFSMNSQCCNSETEDKENNDRDEGLW